MARLINKVYGDALFDYAVANNIVEKTYEESKDILDVLVSSKDLRNFLSDPVIPKDKKKEAIKNLFINELWKENSILSKVISIFKSANIKKGDNTKIFNFLNIIIDKGRVAELTSILEYFTDKVREYKGAGCAYVESAYELDDNQKAVLEKKLIDTTTYNSFDIYYKVDETLISGLKIKIKDRLVDSTLKTKIEDISKNLRGIRV